MKPIELLAPAKDYDCARAAVDCGADAVYIGAPRFGARVDAAVTADRIADAAVYAHRYGARLFVALNTLIYEDELQDAARTAREVCDAGADALIIQDMAMLRMELPPVELHASTQMFTFDTAQARFLSRVGFTRIVLERASTLDQIRAIAEAVPDTEIEAFVHGALCVGYSGRCYLSRSMCSRSGNRGACMQACRLPYDLFSESGRTIVKGRHLLSLQDLNLTRQIGAMIDAGVSSFKIEGRLKDRHYVQNAVAWYRQQLDEQLRLRPEYQRASEGTVRFGFEPDPRKGFARGGTEYYIGGLSTGVASFDTPKSLGEPIGRIRRTTRLTIEGDGFDRLGSGDGICFADGGHLTGTGVNRVEGNTVWPNDMTGFRTGVDLFRNFDRRFCATLDRAHTARRVAIQGTVCVTNDSITLALTDGCHRVSHTIEGSFDQARDSSRALDTLRSQLSKTGDSMFVMERLEIVEGVVRFVATATLNALRREALEALEKERLANYRPRVRRTEDLTAEAPEKHLTAAANVTNSLAARFWRGHGVQTIDEGLDLHTSFDDVRVMRTRYCLRRELGQCLKDGAKAERLFIETGAHRYELQFDCARCEMSLLAIPYSDKSKTSSKR